MSSAESTRLTLHPRRLRHAQACQGEGLAGQASPGALPLRAPLVILSEPRRALRLRAHAAPFVWTAAVRDILAKVNRANTALAALHLAEVVSRALVRQKP